MASSNTLKRKSTEQEFTEEESQDISKRTKIESHEFKTKLVYFRSAKRTFRSANETTLSVALKHNSVEITYLEISESDDQSIECKIEDSNYLIVKFISIEDCERFHELVSKATKTPRKVEEPTENLIEKENKTELAEKAFEQKDLFNKNLEKEPGEIFLKKLIKVIDEYNRNTSYYAPYSAVIQSSGFGKSRQIEILSKRKDFRVVYVNLNDPKRSSIPKCTQKVAKILLGEDRNFPTSNIPEDHWIKHVFVKFFQTHLEYFHNGGEPLKFSYYNDIDKSIETNENGVFEMFRQQLSKHDSIEKKTGTSPIKLQPKINNPSFHTILFVFDEARSLAHKKLSNDSNETYFSIARRAMQLLPSGCFVLFCDTMASISHFMPTSNDDPSARLVIKLNYLLPPLLELPTWDLFRYAREDNMIMKIKTLDQLMSLENVASFGRPLWYAFYSQIKKDKKFQEKYGFKYLILFAKAKLSCSKEIKKIDFATSENSIIDSKETSYCFALALIGCRAVVNLNPVSVLTSRLVADFMAICLKVNQDRTQMFVTYGSEPILAEASAQICFENNKAIFSKAVNAVKETVTQGQVDQGQVGELAARLIVLNAIDTAGAESKRSQMSTELEGLFHLVPITVRDFLKHFVGLDVVKSIENNRTKSKDELNNFLNGIILCNHFIRSRLGDSCTGPQSKAELIKFAMRYAGRICRDRNPDIDIEFPVFLDPNDLTKISYILIQVKTLSIGKTPSAWSRINPFWYEPINDRNSRLKKPFFLSIWMELGERVTPKCNKVYFDDYLEHYVKAPVPVSTNSPKTKPKDMSEMVWSHLQESEYVKEKQIFIYIRGIHTKNYPALTEDLSRSLKDLAFAKLAFEGNEYNLFQEMDLY